MNSPDPQTLRPAHLSSEPLNEILIALKEIMRGNFQHRLPFDDPDSILASIGQAINQTAEELSRNVVAKEYVENILRSMDDMLLVVDEEGRIRTVNTASCRRLGYSPEEFTGQDLGLVIDDEKSPLSTEAFKALALSGASETLKAILRARDETRIPVAITTSGMNAPDGESRLYILLARDMTEVEKYLVHSERSATPWATIEVLSEAIVALSIDGVIIQVNSEFEKGSGWKKQEVIGKSPTELGLLGRDQFQGLYEGLIPLLIQQGSIRNVEVEATRKDGTKIPVLASISLLKDRSGNPAVVLIAIRDISQLKWTEALLQETNRNLEQKVEERTRQISLANEKYNKLFLHSSECILIADDQGQIQDANPKAAEVLGYTGQEILKLQLPALHFAQIASWCETDRDPDGGQPRSPRELEFRKQTGEVFPAEVSCSALTISGQPVVQIMFRDISKRQELLKITSARERERIAEEIVDHLPAIVAITDPSGDIFHINREFETALGWSRLEVIGKTAFDIGMLSPETQARITREVLPELRAKGEVRGIELTILRRDRREMPTRMNWTLLRDREGHPSKVIHVITDLPSTTVSQEEITMPAM